MMTTACSPAMRESLLPHGWTTQKIEGEATYWARPVATDHHGATTNHEGSDLLYVFTDATDFAYIPRNSTVTLTVADGHCRVAIPTARAEADLPFRYGPRESVPIEQRGAGSAAARSGRRIPHQTR